MGVFQSFAMLGATGRGYQKSARKLQRAQANARIQSALRQIEFRKQEEPREQAGLKASAFARGIGKSTIADQDKTRLTNIQKWKMDAANSQYHLALRYKQYLKKKQKFDRLNTYAALADSIVSVAFGAGGGAQGGDPYAQTWDGGNAGQAYSQGGSGIGNYTEDQWGSNI